MAKWLDQGIHHEDKGTNQLVAGVPLFVLGCAGDLPKTFALQLAKRQAVGFGLPTAQAQNSAWWDPLPSLSALWHNSFLLPWDLQGSWNVH